MKYQQQRCADTHPVLQLPTSSRANSRVLSIVGGSVYSVDRAAFDTVISFEKNGPSSQKSLPWTPGHEFCYPITDGCAPGNAKAFQQLVEWVAGQLLDDYKVFVGCIGGHGRTGTFLSALVAHVCPKMIAQDAITYVRNNYCAKAVESESQVKFLVKHYGVKPIVPSKRPPQMPWYEGGKRYTKSGNLSSVLPPAEDKATEIRKPSKAKVIEMRSKPTTMSIHGDNVKTY
jgi:hypothetical protein